VRFEWLVVGSLSLSFAACPEEKPVASRQSRFDAPAARPSALNAEAQRFCDRTWPAEGPQARPYQPPPTRPLEGAARPPKPVGWRWVNAWATWCQPCIEEIALLSRWQRAFADDGVAVSFELLSIDAADAEPELQKWRTRALPGPIVWVASPDDVPAWLEGALGLDPDASIPLHLLIDSRGQLRCARLGAVHPQDFGMVRALLSGP
jgi:thiol-disulfide isomerase/thioredoxin